MKKTTYPLLFSLGFIALSACGGGSDSGSLSADARKYNTLVGEYNDYLRKYKIEGNTAPYDLKGKTPLAQMPTSGTAQYSGVGRVDTHTLPENKALGDARLKANFGSGRMTGNVTGFKTNTGNATAGQLTVDSSINGNRLLGRTTGSIVLNDKTYQIDQLNSGVFLGNSAKAVTITSTDKTSKFDISTVETTIFAESN